MDAQRGFAARTATTTAATSSVAERNVDDVRSSVRQVDAIVGLAAIFEPTVNVVRLKRAMDSALLDECRREVDQKSAARLIVVRMDEDSAQDVRSALSATPHLAEDVLLWSEVLAELTGAERIGARIAVAESSMCPRFHVDRVLLRMVCTYEGRGTEFVCNQHVDRSKLGHAAKGVRDEESGLLSSVDRILCAEIGEIVLLKGEAWPDNLGLGAVHRSPAASREQPRLVLTLDPL